MPDQTVPSPYQYADERVQLGVEPADQDGMIRVRAAGTGCATVIDIMVVGGQRLAPLLGAARLSPAACPEAAPTEPPISPSVAPP